MLDCEDHDLLGFLVDRVIDKRAMSGGDEFAHAFAALTANAAEGLRRCRSSAIPSRSLLAPRVNRSLTDRSGGRRPLLLHPRRILVALSAQALRAPPTNEPDRPARPLPQCPPSGGWCGQFHPARPQVGDAPLQLPVSKAWSHAEDKRLTGSMKGGAAVRLSCRGPPFSARDDPLGPIMAAAKSVSYL